MKREAVQEERQKHKDKNDPGSPNQLASSNSANDFREEIKDIISSDDGEDSVLSFEEKTFLDKLIEIEESLYPQIENPTESVCL